MGNFYHKCQVFSIKYSKKTNWEIFCPNFKVTFVYIVVNLNWLSYSFFRFEIQKSQTQPLSFQNTCVIGFGVVQSFYEMKTYQSIQSTKILFDKHFTQYFLYLGFVYHFDGVSLFLFTGDRISAESVLRNKFKRKHSRIEIAI